MPPINKKPSFLKSLTFRRIQIISMDDQEYELELLELYQKHVAERLSDLSPASCADNPDAPPPDPILSISWFRKLLDAFLCIEAEFKAFLVMRRDLTQFSKPPMDKIISELVDRSVKALDVCNAVTHGIELVRQWQTLAQIAVTALEQRPIGDGQVRRAKKALNTLLTSMVMDDKDSSHGRWMERTWSFGRRIANKDRTTGNFRSLTLSFAHSWSAAKQIQAMSTNLVAPRGVEMNGLILPVYIMGSVCVFMMWALVAAIPCQERSGLVSHFQLPRQFGWAQAIIGLQEKIGEEWKKKEKKGSAGLLEEIQRMEKSAQSLVEFAESFHFPAEEEKVEEVAAQVKELGEICRRMDGLVALQQQVREVFHSIVRSRAEVLFVVDQASKLSSPGCGHFLMNAVTQKRL